MDPIVQIHGLAAEYQSNALAMMQAAENGRVQELETLLATNIGVTSRLLAAASHAASHTADTISKLIESHNLLVLGIQKDYAGDDQPVIDINDEEHRANLRRRIVELEGIISKNAGDAKKKPVTKK